METAGDPNVAGSVSWDIAQILIGVALLPVGRWLWRAFVVAPRLKRLFPINTEKEAQLVIPTIRHDEFEEKEYIRLATPLESVMAVKHLDVIMRPYRATLKFLDVVFSDTISEEKLKRALISIGGPVHNKVTARIMDRVKDHVGFVDYELVVHASKKSFDADIKDEQIVRDVGLLIVTSNPWVTTKMATVIAGCRGYGSIGLLHMLTLSKWRNEIFALAKKEKTSGFAVVASFGVDHFPSGAFGFNNIRIDAFVPLP